jgi:hypothetical protein
MTIFLFLVLIGSIIILTSLGGSSYHAYADHDECSDIDRDGDGTIDCNDPDPLDPTNYPQRGQTIIRSAIDGYGNFVKNGGWTLSKNITLYFRGADLAQDVGGFKCMLDDLSDDLPIGVGETTLDCANPTSFENLTAHRDVNSWNSGRHRFFVIAYDTNGIFATNNAEWRFAVLAPFQGVQKLLVMINNLADLPNPDATKADLLAPLKGIAWKLTPGSPTNVLDDADPTNRIPVCSRLGDFINEVNQKESTGEITEAQAVKIAKLASDIRAAIHCPDDGIVADFQDTDGDGAPDVTDPDPSSMFVVPEFPIGPIAGISSSLVAFAGYLGLRTKKSKQH